jgi:hypothetical protein
MNRVAMAENPCQCIGWVVEGLAAGMSLAHMRAPVRYIDLHRRPL